MGATEATALLGESGHWRLALLTANGLEVDVLLASSMCAAQERCHLAPENRT